MKLLRKVFFVSDSGHDDNLGKTPSTAFRSLSSAFKRLTPESALIILPGEYRSDPLRLTGLSDVDILGVGGPSVFFTETLNAHAFLIGDTCTRLSLSGLQIEYKGEEPSNVLSSATSSIEFSGLTVIHSGSRERYDCLKLLPDSAGVSIRNSAFSGAPNQGIDGVSVEDISVSGTLVY